MREVTRVWVGLTPPTVLEPQQEEDSKAWKKIEALVADGRDVKATTAIHDGKVTIEPQPT